MDSEEVHEEQLFRMIEGVPRPPAEVESLCREILDCQHREVVAKTKLLDFLLKTAEDRQNPLPHSLYQTVLLM